MRAVAALPFVAAATLWSGGCAAPASMPSAAPPDLAARRDLGGVDGAAADLAPVAAAVCGNGDCEAGEDGGSCGSDCCDAATSCDATRGNGGAYFCRSMNGGAFAWVTQNDTLALCDEASEVGVTTWACAARGGVCCSLPGGYVDGPCP